MLRKELIVYPTIMEYFWTYSDVVLGYVSNDAKRFSVRNLPRQSANAEAFAEAYLYFLVSALAKKMPRQLNA